MNNMKKFAVFLLIVMTAVFMSGCSDDDTVKAVDSDRPKSSAVTSYSQTQNSSSSDEISSEEEDENKTVIDFGENTIFDGVEVAADENGEIMCSEIDGALWYKVSDERFSTYKKLSNFVYNSLGSKKGAQFMKELKNCFVDKEDGLYFVNGINDREIDRSKNYLFNDSDSEGTLRLTVSSLHSSECKTKTGIVRSHIDFAKKDGVWKIEDLTLFY